MAMKRLDDFRLRFGKQELVPIIIGGMGVDISTAELALEAVRLGGIGHISDAMVQDVSDRRFDTSFVKEKTKLYKHNIDNSDKSEVQFDLGRLAEAEMRPAKAKAGGPALEVKEGGYARHRGLGVEGKVVVLKGDRATLETPQGRRLECRLGELEPIGAREVAPRPSGKVRVRAEVQDLDSEINLIGRASDDVDSEVYRFVEEALAAGRRFVRIVHGHGTGRLKAAVREALRGHPGIAKVEDAPQAQGGSGATIVTLR